MNRISILKAARQAFAAPAPRVTTFDRVDPKLLSLMSTRYV